MSSFANTLLSGFQTGWGLADGVRDRRENQQRYADAQQQQAFQNNLQMQQMDDERAYRAEQTAIRKQIVEEKMRQQHLDRRLWGAISAPAPKPLPGVATGEGQDNYTAEVPAHPMDAVSIEELSQGSPEVQRAFMLAKEDRAAFEKKQMEADLFIKWARANGNMNRAFFLDKNGKPSYALQTVIDAGKYDTLDKSEIHSSVRDQELNAEMEAEYLAGGRPADRPDDVKLANDYAVFLRMDPALRKKAMETRFLAEQQARLLQPAYANADDPASMAVRIRQATQQGAGANGATIPQRLSAAKTMLTQAEKEYRALTGQAGKSGALVEPSSAIRKSAERFAGGSGDWFKTDATQERHVRMVAAWEKYQQALSDYSSVLANASADAPQRGLLDTADQTQAPTDLAPDEDAILNAFRQKHGREPHQGDIDELEAIGSSMTAGG